MMIILVLIWCIVHRVQLTVLSDDLCVVNNSTKIIMTNFPDNKFLSSIKFQSDAINISSIKYDAWKLCSSSNYPVPNDTFKQLRVALNVLHLTNEDIISCDQLNELVRLEVINFPLDYYSHFGQLGKNVSAMNQSLCEFNLERVTILSSAESINKVIRNESFCEFRKLKHLTVTSSNVSEIEDDAFICLEQLIEIDLRSNSLSNLPRRVFSRNRRLQKLTLTSNRLSSAVFSSLQPLTNLLFLYLNHNQIEILPRVIPLKRLKRSDLSTGNEFREMNSSNIPENAKMLRKNVVIIRLKKVDNFSKLEVLELGGNQISGRINLWDFLDNHINLTELSLDHNKIEGIVESSTNKTKSNSKTFSNVLVDLSFNRIQSLRNVSFPDHVTTFDVTRNRIETVCVDQDFPFTHEYKVENVLRLSGNPLQCNCANMRLKASQYQKLINDFKNLECSLVRTPLDPVEKAPVNLANLGDDEFKCRIEFNRRGECVCDESKQCSANYLNKNCYAFTSMYEKKIINVCENLTKIPTDGYHTSRHNFPLYYMYFKGNDIEKLELVQFDYDRIAISCVSFSLEKSNVQIIESDAFNRLRNLEILSLRDNRIRVLPDNLFRNLTELKELYLSNNRLITLTGQTFNNVIKLELHNNTLTHLLIIINHTNQLILSSSNLTELSLHDNPWSCDCQFIQPFHYYLGNNTNIIQRVKDINCIDEQRNKYNVLQFDLSKCKPFLYLTVITTSTTFAVVIIIIAVLVFLYRREVRVFIYSRYHLRIFGPEVHDDISNKQYDAFMAYSSMDEDFLVHQLMPGLEAIQNPYRLCIHERDFPAGAFIQDSIMEAVRLSSRTIVLLSENFVESGWCRMEFMTAHAQMLQDRCPRVLLIVLGEIPRTLDPEMELYLRTNTYLRWGERLFWDKLYYAMPDQRVTAPATDIMPMYQL